jgi:transposase
LKTGKTAPIPRGGAHNTPFDKDKIFEIIRTFYADPNHSDATLHELQNFLLRPENSHVLPIVNGVRSPMTLPTLCRWLNNEILFTLKVATPEPSSRNSPDVKEDRDVFSRWLLGIDQRRLLYFDEHGFNLWTTRRRARSPIGTPATIPTSIQRMLNCTVSACVSSSGKIHMRPYFGGFTGENIVKFLSEACSKWEELVDPETKAAGCIVILDNCPSHKIELVERACVAPNSFRFLPKYSPHLNIIEGIFNLHKAAIRSLNFRHRAEIIEIDTSPRGERTVRRKAMLLRFCQEGWEMISDNSVCCSWSEMTSIIPKCLAHEDI